MSHRKKAREKPRPAPNPPVAATTRRSVREIDFLAGGIAVLMVALTWSARHTLNPDGISYINLADALRHGDWLHFTQAYWSPLYPALLAVISLFTGARGISLGPWAHWLNGAAVLATIGIIWYWARRRPSPWFGRAALASLLVVDARPPRVEAVTPDLLLLLALTWLAYELLEHRGARTIRVGLLLGLAFLIKTSSWPWLFVAAAVRFLLARRGPGRNGVWQSSLLAGAMMMLWVIPISVHEHAPTLGSAGPLNYCWYIQGCSARTPDTHQGGHLQYHAVQLPDSSIVRYAVFDTTAPWTYEPWGDPTAWAHGVTSKDAIHPDAFMMTLYWGKMAELVFGTWLLQFLLAVVLPMGWVGRRPGRWRALFSEERDALAVMLLGAIGIGEFIAVHAEPRLLAPFAMLFALGFLVWTCPSEEAAHALTTRQRRWWHAASLIGLLTAVPPVVFRIREGMAADAQILRGTSNIVRSNAALGGDIAHRRIVVAGQAIPLMAGAFWVGGHIVAQVLPGSVPALAGLPPAQLRTLLESLFGDTADVVWFTVPGGNVQLLPLHPPPRR